MSERLVESGYGEGILQLYEVLIPYLQKSIWVLGHAFLELIGVGADAHHGYKAKVGNVPLATYEDVAVHFMNGCI